MKPQHKFPSANTATEVNRQHVEGVSIGVAGEVRQDIVAALRMDGVAEQGEVEAVEVTHGRHSPEQGVPTEKSECDNESITAHAIS